MALLEMQDLKTFFTTKRGVVKAVNLSLIHISEPTRPY